MQFVLSSQSDIFIGYGQYDGKGVCCGLSIASVSDLSTSFSWGGDGYKTGRGGASEFLRKRGKAEQV